MGRAVIIDHLNLGKKETKTLSIFMPVNNFVLQKTNFCSGF
jgi:hypothetical protein